MTLADVTLISPVTAAIAAAVAAAIVVGYGLLRWIIGPPSAVARRASLLGLRAVLVLTLVLILLNPSDVTRTPGPIDRPDIFYLVDASQSMAVGDKETRFDHSTRLMREAQELVAKHPHANVKLFKFGHRLAAIEDPSSLGLESESTVLSKAATRGSSGVAYADRVTPKAAESIAALKPTDSDTQLMTALSQASSRFGRKRPAGIVVFSDGRARDEAGLEQFAAQFAALKVPVHVAPMGDLATGGDVAVVAVVAPPSVRRYTEVEVQVFLRSYGYEGKRCEVTLTSQDENGQWLNVAPPAPVTLHDGFQSVGLTYRSDAKPRRIRIAAGEMPSELSSANNAFETEIGIDRTKIRVLYVEGSTQPLQQVQQGAINSPRIRGPFSDLQQALTEDDDIECVVLAPLGGRGMLYRLSDSGGAMAQGFVSTVAELSAFDALILSDVSSNQFTEQQYEWIQNWVSQRGAGLMMVGGQQSFGAGDWGNTPIAELLPVEMANDDWIPGTQVSVTAEPSALTHPLWKIVNDEALNREIVGRFPAFFGANRWKGVKPNLTQILAVCDLAAAPAPNVAAPVQVREDSSFFESLQRSLTGRAQPPAEPGAAELKSPVSNQPAIVAGRFGRGRTMAIAMPITSPWASDLINNWSSGETRHYGKFWRNAIYWLTESSSIGRRRLVVSADKKFYRPGEAITLSAVAYNEAANRTGAYRITSMIEPQASLSDLESNYAPVRWPDGKPRESGETGPFIAWGEEFDLPRSDTTDGKPAYSLELPIADALSIGSASQSLRVEVTAMEDYTQVDSTSLDIQILHDPFEQQNPFPNHELLASIATQSGGTVISEPSELADVLRGVEMKVGAPVVKSQPLWSTWWIWVWMLGLLTAEWIWRRVVGLA